MEEYAGRCLQCDDLRDSESLHLTVVLVHLTFPSKCDKFNV